MALILGSTLVSIAFSGEIHEFHIIGLIFVFLSYFLIIIFYNDFLKKYNISLIQIFLIAFLIRFIFIFVFALFFLEINGFPFVTDKDDFIYNEISIEIAENWEANGINFESDIPLSTGFYSGFPTFSSLLMYLFFKSWIIVRIGNAFLGALMVVYFAKLLRMFYSKDVSNFGLSLVIFSPVFITYSSLQFKDTLLIFLLTAIFYYLMKLVKFNYSLKSIILVILFLTALIFVRAATIIPVLLAFVLLIYFTRQRRTYLLSFFLFLILFGVFFLWSFLNQYSLIDEPFFYFQSRYDNIFGENSNIGIESLISNSNLAFLFSSPLFILGSVILPIPLAVFLPDVQFFTNYNYTANIFQSALTPFFVVSVFFFFKNRNNHQFLWFFIFFYFFYKFGQGLSLSVFNLRQSLPSIVALHLILPLFLVYRPNKKFIYFFIILNLLAIISFAFVRLSTRNLI
ncbi:glycosyltransferase family 39 protein [Cyclobacterium jeungdonense]|uniref:Glycosyltransferase family 39 protein n=1 Tax=Cyclobacterium jeungdonense TaxID=708087 RepID=A0ABT8CBF3_9BACT|nr:glycosyltransferase family 39 protein [Cyclobacterium jeungdonense]MDN3689482.1 glycosyltransferase family 39 protein [Cyclobacterium jeungdonense]